MWHMHLGHTKSVSVCWTHWHPSAAFAMINLWPVTRLPRCRRGLNAFLFTFPLELSAMDVQRCAFYPLRNYATGRRSGQTRLPSLTRLPCTMSKL
ncbi:hypothetical protein EXIGLDRAFT_87562 [Exidia glandulosa HHB12029]|uniref:Uncharacterized protein n=1 Tax=Exidia glandulosa HHB12029 TaxID=1314781 RepID=A0A166BHM8_EXIGL|nr:hypothetical protein EXIGLDRAFT_87562 [Exidia glandulosa HHB12029]